MTTIRRFHLRLFPGARAIPLLCLFAALCVPAGAQVLLISNSSNGTIGE